MIQEGQRDSDIADELDLSIEDFTQLKRRIYAEEIVSVSDRPVEEIYIDYRLQMFGAANDLSDISHEARKARQFQAAMGAVKARAAIIDKVIERGQDMGVIPRAAKRHEVVGGLLVASLTDKELVEQISATSKTARELMSRYGGDRNLKDLPPPDIYSGTQLIEDQETEDAL